MSLFPQNDQHYGGKQPLDPSHPSARLKLSFFRGKEIGGNIYPVARLYKSSGSSVDSKPFLTWTQRVRKAREDGFSATLIGWTPKLLKLDEASGTPRPCINDEGQVYPKDDKDTFFVTGRRSVKSGPLTELALKKAAFGTPMSYKNATSEKRMGSFAYIRRDITRRVKVALGLIMTRGAYVDTDQTSSSKVRIQFNDEDVGRKWSMQGSWNLYIDLRLHTYHCLQVGPIYSTLPSKCTACHTTNSSQSFASSSNPSIRRRSAWRTLGWPILY